MAIIKAIVGGLLIVSGALLTFRLKLNHTKESVSDILAILGIILMVVGVVLLISPLLQ
ncbi:hypothetical protein M0P98_08185 [bacterium]|nr:hypothetical protein [bacterium]